MSVPPPTTSPRDLLRLHELGALYESLRALTSSLDLGEVLRALLARVRGLTTSDALSLLLYDSTRDELVFAATETLRERTVAPLDDDAAADGEPTEDSPTHLVLPLARPNHPGATIHVHGPLGQHAFGPSDRAALDALGPDLRAGLCHDLEHDQTALARLLGSVTRRIPCETATLILPDARGRPMVFRSSRALEPGVIDGVRLRLDRGIAGWVARHREAVRLDDAAADPRHDPTLARATGLVPRGMICVPLVHRERLLGVLQVINRGDGEPFSEDQQRLVQALADHAAVAIANAQLYREVEHASLTDDLTGLGNTRRFHRIFPVLLERGRPLSLILLDLDHLKAVVDGHGHLVGSRTIATVGRLIASTLRPGDVAARFGGDEFVVLLPGTDTETALTIAERIRAAVDACPTPDDLDVDIRHVTASLGVATAPTHATDADGLFRAADVAMYTVKRGGRNGVAVASPPD